MRGPRTKVTGFILTLALLAVAACQYEPPEPGGKDLSSTNSTENITTHLPINLSPRAELTASPKKVFAHYFTPYPVSIDNKPPENDYYAVNYLSPNGEGKKFFDKGGLLRQRPVSRVSIPTYESFKLTDLRHEIRMAAAAGLDGFAINVLSLQGQNWRQTVNLFDLAAEDFDDFFILIMPDMNSALRSKPEELVNLIKTLSEKPAAYRLEDGRLVIAPYLAENQSLEWWHKQKETLLTQGIDIALFPVYHNWRRATNDADKLPIKLDELLYGVSTWGPRTASGGKALIDVPKHTHDINLKWMGPVAPQDVRPKSLIFHEAGNSATFRSMWESAINGEADWAHVISWNDYSEGTEIAPSTLTGHSFYDLNSYYIQWFKFGEPKIERDILYAFYRRQDTSMKAGLEGIRPMKQVGGVIPENKIELLAFLTEPGVLEIEINGNVYSKNATPGINSFLAPLEAGTPIFRLLRDGKVLQTMVGKWEISEHLRVHNLLYHGMTSGRPDTGKTQLSLSWPWRLNEYPEGIKLTSYTEESPFLKQDNDLALRYMDTNDSVNSGFGFSFKNSGEPTQLTIDFKFLEGLSPTQTYNISITDSKMKSTFSVNLQSEKKHYPIEASGKNTYLKDNHWYQLSITLNDNWKDKQGITIAIRSADGNKIYEHSTLGNINRTNEYNLLIRQIGDEKYGNLLVDNVWANVLPDLDLSASH